jgi:hypothetical protein
MPYLRTGQDISERISKQGHPQLKTRGSTVYQTPTMTAEASRLIQIMDPDKVTDDTRSSGSSDIDRIGLELRPRSTRRPSLTQRITREFSATSDI